MLIMITMDKIFVILVIIILLYYVVYAVTVHVISQLTLKNLRDYFSDIIWTICHH